MQKIIGVARGTIVKDPNSSVSGTCPLCLVVPTKLFATVEALRYFRCANCDLIYLPAEFHLSSAEEKLRYELHENDPADPRYRGFLSQLSGPLLRYLPNRASGIDVGCGPGPALAEMLREAGHQMALYDPFYADNPAVLQTRYDFVVSTETVEHFRDPAAGWEMLNKLLLPGGILGIMTSLWTSGTEFEQWHYRRDETHVSFYSQSTLDWIAGNFGWEIQEGNDRYCIFRKDNH